MSKEMKCPVCNCPMKQSTYDYETAEDPETWYCSYMPCDCVCSYGASRAVWQELIRTRKALEIATRYIKHTQEVSPFWFNRLANKTLDEIKTALEQKK